MKGVATLYGSGVLSYRGALALATGSTALGSLASVFLATALVKAFSAKGLVPDALLTPELLCAVGLGAGLTVLLATALGAPISTTHALLGGLFGAGWVAAGPELNAGALGRGFALPLLASPLLALLLARTLLSGGQRAARHANVSGDSCICLEPSARLAALPVPAADGAPGAQPGMLRVRADLADPLEAVGASLTVGHSSECRERNGGRLAGIEINAAVRWGHLISGGGVGFARGLNDTPKIVGLLAGAAIATPSTGALAVGTAMALGGLVAARRVGETMAKKITPMTPEQGLGGNLATSFLVIVASRLGIPVSTTHVSTGAIAGIGASAGTLQRRTTLQVLGAWLLTLPLAAALSAVVMWLQS
ncbi:MAG: inorganic phosphate transporter [Deltaproteobacteria bacterium]|nr:inorganic phosphate transporter [Deltaproteobacteria bacterium]MBW2417077.1 inorganic phosphate transporter [Deltaproteobacteria bacterium]